MIFVKLLLANFNPNERESIIFRDISQTDFETYVICTVQQYIDLQIFIQNNIKKPVFVQIDTDIKNINELFTFLF